MPIGKLSTKYRNQNGDAYTTVRLDSEVDGQLKLYCKATGSTKAGVINRALREFLVSYFAKNPGAGAAAR